MQKSKILLAFSVLSFLVMFTSFTSKNPKIKKTVQDEVDKAVKGAYDGMILHVNQAQMSTTYTAGWKNKKNQIPANANSLFKIASISKLYIAAAVTKLVHMGNLNLDDSLVKLIPEVADNIQYV